MRIDKLRISNQFGKYLDSLSIRQFCKLEDINNNIKQIEYDAIRYIKRRNYDRLIDVQLKKEMFVNEIVKPYDDDEKYMTIWDSYIEEYDFDESAYEKDLKAWQEAEKKVIFKGLNQENTHTKEIIYSNKKYRIMFSKMGIYTSKNSLFDRIDVLYELAEKTNGELETQNLEI